MRDFIKRCPLIFVIIVSAIALTILALIGAATGKYDVKVSIDHPLLVAVLNNGQKAVPEPEKVKPSEGKKEDKGTKAESKHAKPGDIIKVGHARYLITETRKAKSSYYGDSNRIALSSDVEFKKVDKSYFDDAAFVGDSRMEDMSYFSGLDKADFYYKQGVNVFHLMKDVSVTPFGNKTIPDVLGNKQYKKVYIMVGINELGMANPKKFREAYKECVDEIHRLQPNAKIFILSTLHVSKRISDGNDYINNDNLNVRNAEIAKLANDKYIYYLNINEATDSKAGNLKGKYTNDGSHLSAQYYALWVKWLMEHAI